MGQGYNMLGFVVIVILYAVIGLLAAAGGIFIARKILTPKAEQIFFAMFLIMIAAFYLAFTAYFGVATAWRLETAVVVAFVAIGLLGARLPFALIVGYPLHGLWDLLHELQAHGAYSAFEPGHLTAIPLAYGVFCATFDFCMAAYFYARRSAKPGPRSTTIAETCFTVNISPRGACVEIAHPLTIGQRIVLERIDTKRSVQGLIAWMKPSRPGKFLAGVEILNDENFWVLDG